MSIKIGWAKRDISTTEPVYIPGRMYIRVSQGIMDPIMATALVLDGGNGQDAAIFVSCDFTNVQEPFIALVREKVTRKDPSVPVGNILMGATHTHSSCAYWQTAETTPDGKPIYSGLEYREFAANRICDAICEAWQSRKEGGIAYGYGYAVVGHSRRTVYLKDQYKGEMDSAPNGFAKMYGNTKQPDFSHYEAGADHFLNAMFTTDGEGKLTGMVVNVPCPSQLMESAVQLSADFWHDVRQGVAKEFGEEVFVLPQCAAAGDLAPRTLHYKEAQARRMALKYGIHYDLKRQKELAEETKKAISERYDIAQRILDGLRDIHSWAMKDIQRDVTVRHVVKRVPLSRRPITEQERDQCAREIQVLKANAPDPAQHTPEEYSFLKSRNDSLIRRRSGIGARYEDVKIDPTISYEIHVTQVGEIAFASNPFELYQDFMHRMQARSPFVQTFIVQLAGGVGLYLPTERANANKGYSASMFCNAIGYQGGQELVEYTLGVLDEMKEKDD